MTKGNEDQKTKTPLSKSAVQGMVSQDALTKLLTTLADSFTNERKKSEPYKEMFKAGSTYTGLLRHVEMECMGVALDACTVTKERLGKEERRGLLEFMLAVPYLSFKLEKHIKEKEGSACCVDKAFFLLSEHMKGITR